MTKYHRKVWRSLFLVGVVLWLLCRLATVALADDRRVAGNASEIRPIPAAARLYPQTIITSTYLYLPLALKAFSLDVPPSPPSNIRATPISYSQVRLEWRDNAFNETGFIVYEGNNLLVTLDPDVTSYIAGGFEPGSYHCFAVRAFNANGVSEWTGWTCTVTLPRGQVCTEGLINGGFESDVGWEFPLTEYPASYTTARWRSGARAARTGVVAPTANITSYSSVRQPITVPATALTTTLKLWLYHQSSEVIAHSPPAPPAPNTPLENAVARAGDVQYVLILSPNDVVLETLFWDRRNDRAWQYYQYDLHAYTGQNIKLHIGTYNDGQGGITAMYADDVSLEICAPE